MAMADGKMKSTLDSWLCSIGDVELAIWLCCRDVNFLRWKVGSKGSFLGHNTGPSTMYKASGLFNTEPPKRAGTEDQFLEKCTRVMS
jgi:hypothetical protein